jgi:hypothetical protein
MKTALKVLPKMNIGDNWQARSSIYANTQLRAHRRAEKKIKSQKNKINREYLLEAF